MEPTGSLSLEHRPDGSPRGASLLATCARCERLHRAEPLDFNPLCAICAAEHATMRSLGMRGCYPLSAAAIAAELTRRAPGNYALGYREDGRFVVFYVGRSDSDLRRSLQDWVGAPSRYDRHAPSGRAAWDTRPRGPLPFGTPTLGHVGRAGDSGYTHFAYSYAPSARGALEKEQRNYDDFGGRAALDNERPPIASPYGAGDGPAQRT